MHGKLTLALGIRHDATLDWALAPAALVINQHELAEEPLLGRVWFSQSRECVARLHFIFLVLVFGLRISGVVALLHAPVDESAVEFHFVVADEIVQEGSNGAAVFILENPVCAHAAAAAIAGEGADERHDGIFNV